MSIILDALKKADAERHLGTLPGIHATSPVETLPHAVRSARPRIYVASAVLLAAVMGAGIFAWNAFRSQAPAQTPIAATAAAHPPAQGRIAATPPASDTASSRRAQPKDSAETTVPPVTPPPAAVQPAPTEAASGSTARPPALTPAQAPAPAPAIVANEVPVPPPLPKPVVTAKKAPTVPATGEAATAERKTAASVRPDNRLDLPTVDQLPPGVRSELPPLTFSGSLYAANPTDRMLLVGKRMLHEGDEIAPGLVLETILPKSAALRYKGFVFRMPY